MDPKVDYLKRVNHLIAWRDRNAPGKEVRVTEFGWDASTKPAPATGDFAKWVGSSETEQARYLVRSFLLFSKRDVTRA
jgi:serine/threonine-protein kinase ATR